MHPIVWTPFGPVPSYTLFVALGFLCAAIITWLRHRHEGFHCETVASLTLAAALAGLAGARVWFVGTHLELYAPWFAAFSRGGMDHDAAAITFIVCVLIAVVYARPLLRPFHPAARAAVVLSLSATAALLAARVAALHSQFPDADPFDPNGGGLAFFGGFAAAAVACAVITTRRGIPALTAADAVAPGILLACSLGRIGCLLNGCCGGLPARGPLSLDGHWPTQIAESLATATLGTFLASSRPAPRGRVAALAALGYAGLRFILEFFREDVAPAFLGLTPSQAAAAALAALALPFLLRPARPAPAETA